MLCVLRSAMPNFSTAQFSYEGLPQLGTALQPGVGISSGKDVYVWFSNITVYTRGDKEKYKWGRMHMTGGDVHVWIDEIHQNGPAICQGADNIF